MNRGIVVVLGALVSAAAPAALAGQARAPLIVAYIASDGELVPIARYDGTSWRNTWPEPIEDGAPLPVRTVSEIPRAWLGQPVPLTWTAWSQTGKQQEVTVTGVDRDGACVQAITLATSSKPDAPADGLAFNRPTKVDAIVALEQSSPQWEVLRREVVPHFRTAVTTTALPQPGREQHEIGAKVLALGRADTSAAETVVVSEVFRDPRFPVFFIGAHRVFGGIPSDTDYDALSYEGWFRRDRAGALTPVIASVEPFSTAEGKLPRYTPIGILRLGMGSIWAMSEWGKESQTIVLFDISAKGVRKLTSADISGC
ncbi:MAG: hypothetical protein ABW292_18680 [Vicinamibacterales bacterium]